MKLLKKSIVSIEASSLKKQQIDEGIALAQKVDALRQTLAQEETNIVSFRETALKQVHAEIDEVRRVKNILVQDVENLKEKVKELTVTLQADTSITDVIWSKLSIKSDELEKRTLELTNQEEIERSLVRKLKLEEEQIDQIKERARKEFLKAENLKGESEKTLKDIINQKQKIEQNLIERNKEMLEREAVIAIKEREMYLEKKQVEEDKENIKNQRILLIDRERTLERELKRQTL